MGRIIDLNRGKSCHVVDAAAPLCETRPYAIRRPGGICGTAEDSRVEQTPLSAGTLAHLDLGFLPCSRAAHLPPLRGWPGLAEPGMAPDCTRRNRNGRYLRTIARCRTSSLHIAIR